MKASDIPAVDLASIDSMALLDCLPDGAYLTDTDRRIVFWNRKAEAITGWQRADIVGKRCRDNVLCHIDKDGHPLCTTDRCPLYRAIVTNRGSDTPALVFARSRKGTYVPVEVSVAPLHDQHGQVVGGIEIFRDLSSTFEDLEQARTIQRDAVALAPPDDGRLNVAVRYTPHDQVGGDFYRGHMIDKNRFALVLADVVGHGVSAALYTMLLRVLWEEAQDLVDRPGAFLAWLSHKVERMTPPYSGYFATALHVVIDLRDGTYTFASAGHPPPFHVNGENQARLVDVKGPALGLFENQTYEEQKGTRPRGEHLVLYTDGAIEVANKTGDEVGTAGLIHLIEQTGLQGGKSALDEIEANLLRHTAGLSLPDDLTLIHIQRP
jgi:PAS domain S-box-containing protein